jgi:hypothetical protein
MMQYDSQEQARMYHEKLIADAELYRAFFHEGGPASRRSVLVGRRSSASMRRLVSALTQCRWDTTAEIQAGEGSGALSPLGCTAVQTIENTVRGNLGAAQRLAGGLSSGRATDDRDPDSWAIGAAARAILTYATGESHSELTLPALMERLLTLLPGTSQAVRDLLCLSLALAAYSQHNVALGSFLLGHKINALAGSPEARAAANTATRAAFGFSIIAVGDAVTGRRILLGVSNARRRDQTPLFAGIVDAELVGLQLEAGDMTSASHWLTRTERFAKRHDCNLLASRALEARQRLAIPHEGV